MLKLLIIITALVSLSSAGTITVSSNLWNANSHLIEHQTFGEGDISAKMIQTMTPDAIAMCTCGAAMGGMYESWTNYQYDVFFSRCRGPSTLDTDTSLVTREAGESWYLYTNDRDTQWCGVISSGNAQMDIVSTGLDGVLEPLVSVDINNISPMVGIRFD